MSDVDNASDDFEADEQLEREAEMDKEVKRSFVQWEMHGTGFVPRGATSERIKPGIYSVASSPNIGIYLVPAPIITDKLVRLPDSKSDMVIAEIEQFWTLKDRFKKLEFVFKRGFLLWGPPGSGKTSTVSTVMRQIVEKGGIVIMGNTAPQLLTAILKRTREVEPDLQVLVVFEDLDTIIQSYDETSVLSVLDGEDSVNNVVFLATTNYPERLDGRVLNRPSRFDRVVYIGMPKDEARKFYLQSRKLDLDEKDLEKWVSGTVGFSIAQIKEVIIAVFGYGEKFEAVVKRLKAMSKMPKSTDKEPGEPTWGKGDD